MTAPYRIIGGGILRWPTSLLRRNEMQQGTVPLAIVDFLR